MTYLEELREVIHRLHSVEATHVESIPVKEVFGGRPYGTGSSKFSTWRAIPKRLAFMRGRMKRIPR
jgi:hypothetical protein